MISEDDYSDEEELPVGDNYDEKNIEENKVDEKNKIDEENKADEKNKTDEENKADEENETDKEEQDNKNKQDKENKQDEDNKQGEDNKQHGLKENVDNERVLPASSTEEVKDVEDAEETEYIKTIPHPTIPGVHFTTRKALELYDMTEEEIRAEFPPDETAADQELEIYLKEGSLCTEPDCAFNHNFREPQILKPFVSCTIKDCKEHKLGVTRTRENGMSYYENFMLHTPDPEDVESMTFEDAKEYANNFPHNEVEFHNPLEVDIDFDPPVLVHSKALFGHPNTTKPGFDDDNETYVCPNCDKSFARRDIAEEFKTIVRKESIISKPDIDEDFGMMSLEIN